MCHSPQVWTLVHVSTHKPRLKVETSSVVRMIAQNPVTSRKYHRTGVCATILKFGFECTYRHANWGGGLKCHRVCVWSLKTRWRIENIIGWSVCATVLKYVLRLVYRHAKWCRRSKWRRVCVWLLKTQGQAKNIIGRGVCATFLKYESYLHQTSELIPKTQERAQPGHRMGKLSLDSQWQINSLSDGKINIQCTIKEVKHWPGKIMTQYRGWWLHQALW